MENLFCIVVIKFLNLTSMLKQYNDCTVFIPTTAQEFDRKIHTVIQQASYVLWPFSAPIREAFDRQIEKHNSD